MYVIFSKQSVVDPSGCEGWKITSDGKEEADMTTEMLEKILSEENLEEAKRKVMSNKGSAGVDKVTVFQLPKYIEEHGVELCETIRQRRYRPLPVRRVQIPKDDGSKRNLGVPSVKDRWIEQAVCQVLTPIFEKEFSNASYGFRPGRKAEQAVMKALEYMNDGYDWIVDLDLSKFFDNVNQDILMILVHKVIKDPDVESLIRRFLQGGVLVEGTFEETKVGTAQGSPISPLLANIYLNEFDKELDARGLRYARYADDCIICVKSEMAANRVMMSVTKWLHEHLRVEVNATKTKMSRPNDIKYLGFGFYHKQGEWRPKPHIKSIQKLEYKLKPLIKRNWGVSMEHRMKKINEVVRGWINYYRIADMKVIMRRMDQKIRFHIRMCYWKQWKTVRNRANHLYFLGMRKYWCWLYANTRKGYCKTGRWLGRWITDKLLNQKGLLCLVDHYVKKHTFQQLMLGL